MSFEPKKQSTIVVREARLDESESVADLVDAAFAEHRSIYLPFGEAAARQSERAEEGSRLVALLDGVIVGTVQVAEHRRHVHLLGLAVYPECRGCGIALHLVDRAAAIALKLGHDVVVVDTIRETGNVSFFENMGFRVVEEGVATWCESDDYPVVHEVKMERAL